ncbi:MAG: PCMD domain-containing protein [Bacteroidaceae bacterium]|nr:PCMD domain-containing protein [Bacteroidaceae bacterium]
MKKIYSILTIICLALFSVSCANELLQGETQDEGKGYLKLDLTTLVSTNTNTRATDVPQGYNAKTIAVKITDSEGTVVKETQDVANDQEFKGNIMLAPGTYSITASSAGWDGSNSGFGVPYYAGSTKATIKKNTLTQASLTLTQANVKVTVNYSDNFRTYFKQAKCIVTSGLDDVAMQVFSLNTVGAAYFPVAPLNFLLAVTNMSDQSYTMSKDITEVQPRDHFIINYKIADAGSIGGITVKIDDETHDYIFDIEVPRKSSTSLNVSAANAFTTFAYLTGAVTAKTSEFSESNLTLQWKKSSDLEWTSVPASALTKGDESTYTYKLANLTPNTEYVYRMNYNDGNANVNSNEVTFTTESILQPENAGFENWYKDGAIWYPNAQGSSYWSTSNSGSAGTMGESYNVTTGITSGAYNGTSANLQSMYVIIKFAAASIFTGTFDGMIGTNGAKLGWGVPFTSRPAALKGYMKYTTGGINRGNQPSGVGAPAKGDNDACQIFCALLTERLKVANASNSDGYELSTTFNWQNDPRIVAYGQITQNTSDANWKSFNIPLVYRSLTTKPKYMLIVCSSSKWGDYFYGYDGANLKLDDFSFEYGEPTFQ